MGIITREIIIEKISQSAKDTFESVEQQLIYSFWNTDDLISLNTDYNVDEFVPGFFGIGTDGGDEMLAVEFSSGKVYSIPFVPMDSNEKVLISDSIDDLIYNK